MPQICSSLEKLWLGAAASSKVQDLNVVFSWSGVKDAGHRTPLYAPALVSPLHAMILHYASGKNAALF